MCAPLNLLYESAAASEDSPLAAFPSFRGSPTTVGCTSVGLLCHLFAKEVGCPKTIDESGIRRWAGMARSCPLAIRKMVAGRFIWFGPSTAHCLMVMEEKMEFPAIAAAMRADPQVFFTEEK